MRTQTWKSAERRIAELLGLRRVPVTGRGRGNVPDLAEDPENPSQFKFLSIEVKHGKGLPKFILNAFAQAIASVRGNQLPVVIMHATGTPYPDSIIAFRLKDFIAWFESPERKTPSIT